MCKVCRPGTDALVGFVSGTEDQAAAELHAHQLGQHWPHDYPSPQPMLLELGYAVRVGKAA